MLRSPSSRLVWEMIFLHPVYAGEDSFPDIPIAEAVYQISVITDFRHDAYYIGRPYVKAGERLPLIVFPEQIEHISCWMDFTGTISACPMKGKTSVHERLRNAHSTREDRKPLKRVVT